MNELTAISLFSGGGGLDLGFEKAGFKVVFANDIDKDARLVYSMNHDCPIDGRDIREIPTKEIPFASVLLAGFPCQPFSNAGSRRSVYDSRGTLYQECLRIISQRVIPAVVFENVKGILSSKYFDGRLVPEVIKDDLEKCGYKVSYQLVNAADYGVPQNRQRVLFVAVNELLCENAFRFPPKQPRENLTLGDILNVPESVENQVDWELSSSQLEMVSRIPEGGSWKDIPYEFLTPRFKKIRDNMRKYHSPKFYRRFSRDEICGTITASAQPENCGIIHPTENRRFTVREAARIQTFPDDFRFLTDTPRNIVAMYKVIGNAVPVELARNIANSLKEQAFGGD